MEEILIRAGLTKLQAESYLYLIENGPSAPKELIKKLKISRTNTYKVLESLEDINLVERDDKSKKIIYIPSDPTALSSLVAEKRNRVISLEHHVDTAIRQLRTKYSKNNSTLEVITKQGKEAMIMAYENQANYKQPIYFYKTRVDIPFLGYEIMDKIRKEQAKLVPRRYGITPDSTEAPQSKHIDESTNLTRTWVEEKAYTMPVEWSVAGDELLIQLFDGEGSLIRIKNGLVAEAFRQIWTITDKSLRLFPDYQNKPHNAKRQK